MERLERSCCIYKRIIYRIKMNRNLAKCFEYLVKLILAFGIEVVVTELGRRFPSAESRLVILRHLLSHAPSIATSIYPEIYWGMIDWCGTDGTDARDYLSRPEVMVLFVQYCDRLIAAFGRRRAMDELRRRYPTKAWHALVRRTWRAWLFPRAIKTG